MAERSVLRKGILKAFGTGKAAAHHLNYSEEMISKIFTGERRIATDQQPRWARSNILAGMAIAEEATSYRCFSYIEGDRHMQVMIRRVEKEDAEADAALREIPWLLLDRKSDDLTAQEKDIALIIGQELCDRIHADLNLVVELDDQLRLGLIDYLTERKSPLLKQAR